jgi:hypothetical protein
VSQQTTFLSLGCLTKRTRADRFLDEMNRVVPWTDLAEVVAPHYRPAGTGRPLTEIARRLRLHCLQLWYNLSDPGLEGAVHDRLSFQRFLGLDPLNQRVPDETTVLNFRRLLEQHGLVEAVGARLIDPHKRKAQAPHVRMLAGLVIYGAAFALYAGCVYRWVGLPFAGWYALALPLTGLVGHYYLKEFARLTGSARTASVLLRAPLVKRRVLRMRAALLRDIEGIRTIYRRTLKPGHVPGAAGD